MRFVDLAIDLAAVLSASRSVASKHVALRSRQIDAYTRGSTLAASLKQSSQAAIEKAQNVAGEVKQQSTDVQHEARRSAGESDSVGDAVVKTEAAAVSSESETATEKSGRPSTFEEFRRQMGADGPKPSRDDMALPSDVDVGIFHTARGSGVLHSIRAQRSAGNRPGEGRPGPGSGGPVKEHPLRYWGMTSPPPLSQSPSPSRPPPPPLPKEAVLEQSSANLSSTGTTDTREYKTTETEKETTESADQQTSPSNHSSEPTEQKVEPPRSQPSKSPKVKKEEIIELAKTIPHDNSEPRPSYSLRESKVPSSRLGRIWNYGGLATGMLGGAITEGVSRAFGGGGSGSILLSGANMERLVSRLSKMRGAALKLGQMMSFQDSKMLPKPLQDVLQRVQDRADYMPAWQRDRVMVSNLGENWRDLYSEFEEKPIAAASIGQVHRARLKSNGKRIAVKIQFPGVADSINSDLDNIGILLNATQLLPKGLYLNKTIDNARTELGWECDYLREAECAMRYKEILKGQADVFQVPTVYAEASGKQVLTMDFMDGVTVTRIDTFTQEQRDWIGTQIMRLCLREITEFKFMQTDPNWTNFLYNADADRLVLLDFGASREYSEKFVRQYVQLLEAASRSDRQAVKDLSESLGYLTGHESKTMLDAHIASVLTLAEPFLASAPEVYDFKDQTITERVKALIPVMLHERLAPPPEETYSLHRKLSGAFLLCSRLGSKVRCREMFDVAVAKSGYCESSGSDSS